MEDKDYCIEEDLETALKQNKSLQAKLDKELLIKTKVREWCYKHGQEINATDILQIIEGSEVE